MVMSIISRGNQQFAQRIPETFRLLSQRLMGAYPPTAQPGEVGQADEQCLGNEGMVGREYFFTSRDISEPASRKIGQAGGR
jgi:hypothetical protein